MSVPVSRHETAPKLVSNLAKKLRLISQHSGLAFCLFQATSRFSLFQMKAKLLILIFLITDVWGSKSSSKKYKYECIDEEEDEADDFPVNHSDQNDKSKVIKTKPHPSEYGGFSVLDVTSLVSMLIITLILHLLENMPWRLSAVIGFGPLIINGCLHFAFLPSVIACGLYSLAKLLSDLSHVVGIWIHLISRAWVGLVVVRSCWTLLRM